MVLDLEMGDGVLAVCMGADVGVTGGVTTAILLSASAEGTVASEGDVCVCVCVPVTLDEEEEEEEEEAGNGIATLAVSAIFLPNSPSSLFPNPIALESCHNPPITKPPATPTATSTTPTAFLNSLILLLISSITLFISSSFLVNSTSTSPPLPPNPATLVDAFLVPFGGFQTSTSLDLMSFRFGECSVRSRRESLFRCCVSRELERACRAKSGEALEVGVVEKVRS